MIRETVEEYWYGKWYYGGREITELYDIDPVQAFGDELEFVNEGFSCMYRKSPWDLYRVAQNDESPWSKVWKDGEGYKLPIPNRLIVDYARRYGNHNS